MKNNIEENAIMWLKKHNLEKVAKGVKIINNNLEFYHRDNRNPKKVVYNVVSLKRGDWVSTTMFFDEFKKSEKDLGGK